MPLLTGFSYEIQNSCLDSFTAVCERMFYFRISIITASPALTAMCRMNTDLLMNALLIFTFFWWAYGIEGRGRQEEGLFVPLSSSAKAKSITSSLGLPRRLTQEYLVSLKSILLLCPVLFFSSFHVNLYICALSEEEKEKSKISLSLSFFLSSSMSSTEPNAVVNLTTLRSRPEFKSIVERLTDWANQASWDLSF